MNSVEIVRELDGFPGRVCLVRKGSEFFAVSSIDIQGTGPETLVFSTDEDGDITDYAVVAGGPGVSRTEAIAALAAAYGIEVPGPAPGKAGP